MKYRLQDLIDLEQFQSLMDRLNEIYPFPSAVIDNEGVILVATAWQDICTKFHRQNSDCEKECIKSDQYILEHLAEANPAVSYRCPHGLIDNAMPIMVDGHHLGSFFTGQFFLEEPDLDFFREQARKFGFDEDAYLDAVKRVPVWRQEQLDNYLLFIKEMIGVLSSVGLKNLKAREADAALRESEYFFRESQRAAFIGSYKTDFVTGTWESSEVLDRIFGIDQDFARTVENWLALVHPKDREMMSRYLLEEVIGHARPFNKEYRIIRKSDGAVRWVNGLGEVGLDAESRVVSLIGTIQDITERKQVEEALRESEYRWKFAVEGSGDGLWDWNVSESTVFFSTRWKEMLGFSEGEIGSGLEEWTRRVHPDDLARAMADVQTHLAGTTPLYSNEHRISCKDGTWKWILDRGVVVSRDDAGKPLRMIGSHTDVTDRKRATEALHDREQRLRSYFNSPIIGIAITSPQKGWLETNLRLCEMLGYSADELMGGLNWADLTHPDDLAADVAQFERVLTGEIDNYSLDKRFVRKNGEIIWTRLGVGCVRKSDGIVDYMVATLEDISERKRAEEKLREREAHLRALIETIPDLVWLKDADGVYLACNPRFERFFGATETEIVGKTDHDFLDKEQADFFRENDLVAIAAGASCANEEEVAYADDGHKEIIETVKTPMYNSEGKLVGVLGVGRDITERKQAEEERERLMAAIEQVAETIVITDTDGTIQYANPYFEQCTGHTCKEAIGQNPRILNSGEHDDAFYKQMWDTLKRGDVWTGQIVNKKKDGTLFTEEATISPVRDATGKTVNYVAVKRDITHEIELNTQLRQAQKMEAVGQLAGGIAHDFNNLLQAILGYGYLALREVGEDGPAHAFIEAMMRAGERATTLVSQLLAFSRRQVLDMKDVNLNDSIADVLKMLRRVIGEHITLDVIGSHDLGIVRADPGQIDQILMNLCVNARDAMGKSGQITIETENVWIDDEFCGVCTWARPGRYVLLSVTDTGCGMDQETLGKIFEPFFTTKDVGKGTGLGLATVYGIVRQHEGLVHVYSEVGQGTTFKIYLPLAERSSAVVGKNIEGPVPDGIETILLAEDNETLLKLTKHFLEHAGYTVLIAVDGQDALRVFEEHADEIDMALLDVMMPNLSGKAVFERIREMRPHFPFLFASGYSMGSLHDNFTLAEGLQLIQKPFRRDDLLRKVREVLDNGSASPDDN